MVFFSILEISLPSFLMGGGVQNIYLIVRLDPPKKISASFWDISPGFGVKKIFELPPPRTSIEKFLPHFFRCCGESSEKVPHGDAKVSTPRGKSKDEG